ncbi:MAG TPA: DISARM system helicase DrmA [Bryobacteraceae bacterium]
MTSAEIREELVNALELDLIGPTPEELGDAAERLDQPPSRWYLTGFLVPANARETQATDAEVEDDALETAEPPGATDDDTPRERTAVRERRLPSSIGLSVLLPAEAKRLRARVTWGDYRPEILEGAETWKRTAREEWVELDVRNPVSQPREVEVPGSGGLTVALLVRAVGAAFAEARLAAESKTVSVFLVNKRRPEQNDRVKDRAFAFQARLDLYSDAPHDEAGFIPRPDIRGLFSDDWDDRVADLQYRDCGEYAVGHNASTHASSTTARTCWIPRAEVERVEPPSKIENVELGMHALAGLTGGAEAWAKLAALPNAYRSQWIEPQRAALTSIAPAKRRAIAEALLNNAEAAARRIERGIELLRDDPQILLAFRTANRAMADAARQRLSIQQPEWRPFQLAFILMNLEGIADPHSADRAKVDLLFFPTGGGKTEAYLGLAAFTLVLRRLRNPGVTCAGTSVLMRYTLRLLTLDQLGRAATLICALELIRQTDKSLDLGEWPFEIGLWVGKAATPNRMGSTRQGENDEDTARRRTIRYLAKETRFPPVPIEKCPWCGKPFSQESFKLAPNQSHPKNLRIKCADFRCAFSGRERDLPIVAVDEPIYRRLPCFVIATVDKFAALPWLGRVGAFFGRVERFDADGLYGPCDPGIGTALPGGRLPPPDLIVQDELHLISGPLGTIAGLYETAIDELCADGESRPKIISSTATVRRADAQIRALFGRTEVAIFPPPGPDRRNSFFAQTVPASEISARRYVGVAAPGRNVKSVLLRVYLALLCRAHRFRNDPASDPYRTLVGYFNALRELGGARRLIEDEVRNRALRYDVRKRVDEPRGLFEKRELNHIVTELTSRVETSDVAEAKRRLDLDMTHKDAVDIAIATNMISVGLDITRLGLMVVFGQPKTTAEYIQATSRVGREKTKPGLVVTILNPNKPRDRSHFERFAAYHQSFYRGVEATSVTPFSPRALDRALAAATVALARHGHKPMTRPGGADAIVAERANLAFVVEALERRAEMHKSGDPREQAALRQIVRTQAISLLDEWKRVSEEQQAQTVRMKYYRHEGDEPAYLLRDYLADELKTLPASHWKARFRAKWSMRDVEPAVNVSVQGPGNQNLDEEND